MDNGFGQRQIFDPSGDKHGSSEFKMLVQQSIEGYEYRELEKHGKTSSEWIYLLSLVQLTHLLVQFGRIILVFGFQLLHLRSKSLHLRRRLHAFLAEWLEHDFDENRQQDNRNSVVGNEPIEELEQPFKDRFKPTQP